MDNKEDIGTIPGHELGCGGRRFWFNLRMMMNITRISAAELGRRMGLLGSSINTMIYLADTRANDAMGTKVVLAASEYFGIPADVFVNANPGRICYLAQRKRFEYRGHGVAKPADPYHLAFMDCLSYEDAMAVVKKAYSYVGLDAEEIDGIMFREEEVEVDA